MSLVKNQDLENMIVDKLIYVMLQFATIILIQGNQGQIDPIIPCHPPPPTRCLYFFYFFPHFIFFNFFPHKQFEYGNTRNPGNQGSWTGEVPAWHHKTLHLRSAPVISWNLGMVIVNAIQEPSELLKIFKKHTELQNDWTPNKDLPNRNRICAVAKYINLFLEIFDLLENRCS